MHPASNLTLDKVTIAGFRDYRDSKTIGFNGKSAVLLGHNMSGKSSTLGAIEWCLFRDFYSLPGDRRRTRDELVNDHSPSTSVKVELARDGNRFVIERVKQMGESKSRLRVTLEDGSVVLSVRSLYPFLCALLPLPLTYLPAPDCCSASYSMT